MAARTCPKCQTPLVLDEGGLVGEVICSGCGARLRLKAPPRPAPPPVPVLDDPPPSEPDPLDAPKPKRKKKKKKTAKSAGWLDRLSPRALVAGGVGVFLLFIGIVLVIVLAAGGKGDGGGGQGGGGSGSGNNFAVVDAPVEGVAEAKADVVPPPVGRKPRPVAELPAEGKDDTPLPAWALRPDPPTAVPEPAMPLWGKYLPASTAPALLFASLNGPFVAVPARYLSVPPDKKEPFPPSSLVFDLRTGKQAGEFATRDQFYRSSRLSPDGRLVLSPSQEAIGNETLSAGWLFVYKQGDGKAAAKFQVPGNIAWTGFVANDRVAVYTFDPKPILHVYDGTDGKLVKAVPLAAEMFPPPQPPANLTGQFRPKFWYEPRGLAGAVSPGGRYVVLGGKTGLAVLSVADGRQVAELATGPVADWPAHLGLNFSPDGAEFYAITVNTNARGERQSRLRGWSLATGRTLFDCGLADSHLCGPPLRGPEPGTMILPSAGDHWGDTAMGSAGPDGGTHPGAVVETLAGLTVHPLIVRPVRWSGADGFLCDGPLRWAPHLPVPPDMPVPDQKTSDPKTYQAQKELALMNPNFQAVYTVPFDRATYRAKAGPTLAAVAPRPKVAPGGRNGLVVAKPEPPANWSAPPSATSPPRPAERAALATWPTALVPGHAATISFDYKDKPRWQYEVTWHRHDLRTGKKEADPVRLWPWAEMTSRHVTMIEKFDPPPAALTDDGQRLALRDPADSSRVDVWDGAGNRLTGLVPYGRGVAVEWLGWAADGRLLTLGAGRVTSWDLKTAKAAFEVVGGYVAPVALAPHRAWIAAPSAEGVDLLDAATGKCLGRCKAPAGAADYLAVAVSTDGKALAAARPSGVAVEKGAVTRRPTYFADVWDLSTGETASTPFGWGKFGALHWCSPDHLLATSDSLDLIDRKAGAVVIGYAFPPREGAPEGHQWLAGMPDGRVWAYVRNAKPTPEIPGQMLWRSQTIPDLESDPDKLVLADDRAYLRPKSGSIRVEVDVGDADRSKTAARKLAGELQAKGHTMGPGGMTLRVTYAVVDSRQEMTFGGPNSKGQSIPAVEFTFRLAATDGSEAWRKVTTAGFLGMGSKYYTKSKNEGLVPGGMMGSLRTDFYDFGGRGMRAAFAEEILETKGADLSLPEGGLPELLVKAGGEFKPLPAGRQLKLDPGP